MAYRSWKQESTEHTPNIMFLGCKTDLPVDLLYEYVAKLKYRLKTVHEMSRNSHMEAGQKQKLGDAVWLRSYAKSKGLSRNLSRKLQLHWEGPFKIVGKILDLTYKILRSRKADSKVIHFNRLKTYRGN